MAHASNNATWTNSAATPITAATLEAQENATDQVYTSAFGSVSRTKAPSAWVYYTADSATLNASTDYIMAGGWANYTDTDGMITTSGGTISTPTIITAPVSGMYHCEWNAVSSATSGSLVGRLLINANNANSVTSRVTASSFLSGPGFAQTGEATHLHISAMRNLNAGDQITAALYSTVSFVLKASFFGQPRQTMWGIRYLGPLQAP